MNNIRLVDGEGVLASVKESLIPLINPVGDSFKIIDVAPVACAYVHRCVPRVERHHTMPLEKITHVLVDMIHRAGKFIYG